MGRPHKDRLIYDLAEVRKELTEEVAKLKPGEFTYAPKDDMKNCRALIQEIGSMEKICVTWIDKQQMLEWDAAVAWSGDNADAIMKDLTAIRSETIAYLHAATEDTLQVGVPVP